MLHYSMQHTLPLVSKLASNGMEYIPNSLIKSKKHRVSDETRCFYLVAGAGFEPTTSGLSLRAALRCPKKSSDFRFSSIFSTATEKGASLLLPLAAGNPFSQRATLIGLITRRSKHISSPQQKRTAALLGDCSFSGK